MGNLKLLVVGILVVCAAILNNSNLYAQGNVKGVTVIELAQTPGEFNTKELTLKPGQYQFKVKNQNVDKDLGFVIQRAADKNVDVMKSAVPNSFTTELIKKGETKMTGVVTLEKGEYVYSCPLNPTPQYKITVK
ncbi:MAG: hypothetical protein ACK4SF_18475 [Algoriphagus aquaeductus]|uniref:hypothetical protein n=1 Tax=Algoriphagus aquaeductus TaxID=475299 RepID=UPI00391AC48B